VTRERTRIVAIAAAALLALAVALTPWFSLSEYQPNGWDATWWARAAALAAIAAVVTLRLGRDREAAALAALALIFTAIRAIAPPDFGFAFDGLKVPVSRQWGLYLALGAGALATAAAVRLARSD
jgi:hypothetical protein